MTRDEYNAYLEEHKENHYCIIKTTPAVLDEVVPPEFPNANGRTFRDYTIRYAEDEESNVAYMFCGHYQNGINRMQGTTTEELNIWVDCFGLSDLITDRNTINELERMLTSENIEEML